MTNPRVSVVMPVYNVEAYVAEAINSVLTQTFADFELIIVDDGGQDGSLEICRRYMDRRIRIISQANRGLAGARNTGIAAARGAIVALLDSDDRWLPEKLALHVIHLDNAPKIGVSYAPSRFIDAAGQPMRIAQRPKLHRVTARDIFCRNPVGNGSAPVIRRSSLETVAFAHPVDAGRVCWFDESLRQSEDIEMWLRLALVGKVKFEGISPVLTEYRLGSGGLSAQIGRQFETWLSVVERVQSYAPEFAAKHVDLARSYQLRYLARRAIQLGDPALALALLGRAADSSFRPLMQEPGKTLTTLGAAMVGSAIGGDRFARLAGRAAGGKLVA